MTASAEALTGHIKVTRGDWLRVARDLLVQDGIAGVKVLTLSERLGVSRSSFYWYFKTQAELRQAMLDDWAARNTQGIVAQCGADAATINAGLCNFFTCFVDETLFDPGLDFAVRGWARSHDDVRKAVEAADTQRITALRRLFMRFRYAHAEADARARIVYFMQLGYHALDQREAMRVRMERVPEYLKGFSGQDARKEDMARLRAVAAKAGGKTGS